MTRSSPARGLALLGFAFLASSCSLFGGDKDGSFTVSVSAPALSIFQSVVDTVVVTVTRSSYSKAVTLTVNGLPDGVTAEFDPSPVTSPGTTSNLVITASGTAAVGTTEVTVLANGEGVAEQQVPFDLTIGVTGTFTLGTHGPAPVAAQGGGSTSSILVNRSGGHADNVSFTVTGAPTGVTATISPTSTNGGAASLAVTAAASAATGTYPLQITATAPGLSNQVTAVNLTVIAAPSTASLTLNFCPTATPIWFAYQNEGYGWQNVLPVGSSFTFPATSKVGIAYTYSFTSSNETQVRTTYASRAELSSLSDADCSGTKSVGGSVVGASSGQSTRVAMGATVATATQSAPTFTLNSMASRTLDLIATKGTISSSAAGLQVLPDMILMRRALNPTHNSTLSPLDFGSAEAFAPVNNLLTFTNAFGGDVFTVLSTLWTSTNTYGTLSSGQPSVSSATVYGVPAAKMVAGDLHELLIEANQTATVTGRQLVAYVGTLTDRNEALPAALGSPAVTIVSMTPYLRLRQQLPAQSDYGDAARLIYRQSGSGSTPTKFVFIAFTKGFLGATPAATWDFLTGDFTGVTGFNPIWMPTTTDIDYQADAYGGPGSLFFGGMPVAGDYIRYAYRVESLGPLLRANAVSMHQRAQYLRR